MMKFVAQESRNPRTINGSHVSATRTIGIQRRSCMNSPDSSRIDSATGTLEWDRNLRHRNYIATRRCLAH